MGNAVVYRNGKPVRVRYGTHNLDVVGTVASPAPLLIGAGAGGGFEDYQGALSYLAFYRGRIPAAQVPFYREAALSGRCARDLLDQRAANVPAGKVLEFDGERDGVEVPDTRARFQHLLEGQGSIDFWCRPARIVTGDDSRYRQFAVSFHGAGRPDLRDLNIGLSRHGLWWFSLTDGGGPRPRIEVRSRPAPATHRWYHVAVILGGEDRGLYVNGEKTATWREFEAAAGPWENNLHLGFTPGADHHWHGNLARVRIWDRNLTLSDLVSGMTGPVSADAFGLAGYWPMDEGSGDRVRDLAGSHPGHVRGAAHWHPLAPPPAPDLSEGLDGRAAGEHERAPVAAEPARPPPPRVGLAAVPV